MCPYKSAYDTTFIVIRTAASGKTYVNRLYSETQTMLPIIPTRTRRIVSVTDHDVLSDRNPIERNKTAINITARIVPTLAVILLFITFLFLPSFKHDMLSCRFENES